MPEIKQTAPLSSWDPTPVPRQNILGPLLVDTTVQVSTAIIVVPDFLEFFARDDPSA
jgi:hypothetical protein